LRRPGSGLDNGGTSFTKESTPKAEEERLRRIELRKQQTTFAAVAEDYLELHVKGQRRASDSEREIRKELLGPLGDRPIASITREDMVLLVDSVARRPAPYLAHIVLGHARSLFNWAINRGTYGLETSPCDRVKPAALIGPKQPRQRILSDDELRALWHVSGIRNRVLQTDKLDRKTQSA